MRGSGGYADLGRIVISPGSTCRYVEWDDAFEKGDPE